MNPDELRRWCIEKIIEANKPEGVSWPVLLHDAACLEDWVLNGLLSAKMEKESGKAHS